DTVGGHGESGLRGGITQARHVDGKKRQHERSELVQERSEKKNPRAARQSAQVLSQSGVCFVHGENKKPTGLTAVGFKNLVSSPYTESLPQPPPGRRTRMVANRQEAASYALATRPRDGFS